VLAPLFHTVPPCNANVDSNSMEKFGELPGQPQEGSEIIPGIIN
jgi:hypothetical protein